MEVDIWERSETLDIQMTEEGTLVDNIEDVTLNLINRKV